MRSSYQIKADIAELEAKLKEAEKLEEDAKSGSPTAIAELIHSQRCKWNHTDGCGWYYESWDKPGYARNEYLEKAHHLIANAKRLAVDPLALLDSVNNI